MKTKKRLTKRISRRELKRDPFVDRVFDWALWGRENARLVAIAVGAIVLVVLGVVLFRSNRAAEATRAAERYQQVWQAYAAGNYQLAANDFRQFRNQYGGSDYADDATIYLADSYYRTGDYAAAIEILESFDDQYGDSPLRYAGAKLLGAAYESSGDWMKATEVYGRAREVARYDFQAVHALLDQARAYEGTSQPERAAAAYRELLERYPESSAAAQAKVRLAELTAEPVRSDPEAAARASATEAPTAGVTAPPASTAPGGETSSP